MGIFDFVKKGHQTPSTTSSTSSDSVTQKTSSPTNSIEKLNLRKETFALSLRKKDMEHVVARVAVAVDKSGSMESLYSNGTVQETVERLLPIGLKMDDNGELDMWIFSDHFQRLPAVREDQFHDYVQREIVNKHRSWGGTQYAPILNDIVHKYVKEEPSKVPTFVLFITDGENSDHRESEHIITHASKHNIFFQFVGIGHEDFYFLKKLDTMSGRFIDNANFLEIKNISRISDEQLYDMLLNEYPSWEKEARTKGLIS